MGTEGAVPGYTFLAVVRKGGPSVDGEVKGTGLIFNQGMKAEFRPSNNCLMPLFWASHVS